MALRPGRAFAGYLILKKRRSRLSPFYLRLPKYLLSLLLLLNPAQRRKKVESVIHFTFHRAVLEKGNLHYNAH